MLIVAAGKDYGMAPGDTAAELARMSDAELLRRAARIEREPFEVLYDRHSASAFSLARHMLGPAQAEDAVQEAFLALWRSASTFDPAKGSVRSWLLGMVRNRSIDFLRTLGVHERRRVAFEGLEERLTTHEELEPDLVRREEAGIVRTALAALPRDQRRVLELAYFGGWTQNEIADLLDVPLGTVKGRTRLGLARLKAALDGVIPAAG